MAEAVDEIEKPRLQGCRPHFGVVLLSCCRYSLSFLYSLLSVALNLVVIQSFGFASSTKSLVITLTCRGIELRFHLFSLKTRICCFGRNPAALFREELSTVLF